MEKKFKIAPPSMPNFVRFEVPPGKREDGVKFEQGFAISDFTHEEAIEYAELMRVTFMAHWANKASKR